MRCASRCLRVLACSLILLAASVPLVAQDLDVRLFAEPAPLSVSLFDESLAIAAVTPLEVNLFDDVAQDPLRFALFEDDDQAAREHRSVVEIVRFRPPVEAPRDGPHVELKALTAKWCVPCRKVHDAARGVTGVTLVDIDELPDVARELCGGELPPSVPCYVRVVDGKPVARWLGVTDRAGLIRMRDGR